MRRKSLRIIAVLCVFVALLSTVTVVFAKYIGEWISPSKVVVSDGFVFTSDYLVKNGKEYDVYGDSVAFTVSNYDGKNTAKKDITYTVSVTDGGSITGETTTLIGNAEKSDSYILKGTGRVTVTATSSAPYEETISATFVFTDRNSHYEVEDKGYYIVLHLYIGAELPANGITVEYGTQLAPDNTNELMENWTSGTSGTLTGLATNAHYELVFYENTADDYTQVKTALPSDGTVSLAE